MPTPAAIRAAIIECIECGVRSEYRGKIKLGVRLTCPECQTWMQVVSLDPIEVDWFYDEPQYDDEQQDE